MVFCQKCGASNKDDDKFCTSCGAKLAGGEKPKVAKPQVRSTTKAPAPQKPPFSWLYPISIGIALLFGVSVLLPHLHGEDEWFYQLRFWFLAVCVVFYAIIVVFLFGSRAPRQDFLLPVIFLMLCGMMVLFYTDTDWWIIDVSAGLYLVITLAYVFGTGKL